VSRFFPESPAHPPVRREEPTASPEEAVGVLGCTPGTPKVGLSALPACLWEERQTQGLIARAEQTPAKNKCKEHKAPDSSLLGRNRNVVGSKEYKPQAFRGGGVRGEPTSLVASSESPCSHQMEM